MTPLLVLVGLVSWFASFAAATGHWSDSASAVLFLAGVVAFAGAAINSKLASVLDLIRDRMEDDAKAQAGEVVEESTEAD